MMIDDTNFIQQLVAKNEDALEYVIKKYKKIVSSVIDKYLNLIPSYKEDCINDVFFAVWENADTYDSSKNTFANWICGVARIKSLDYQRKFTKLLSKSSIYEENIFNNLKVNDIYEVFEKTFSKETEQMLSCLSPKDRELFIKLYVNGETFEEISCNMGVSKSVLYNRLSRAKKAIRNLT